MEKCGRPRFALDLDSGWPCLANPHRKKTTAHQIPTPPPTDLQLQTLHLNFVETAEREKIARPQANGTGRLAGGIVPGGTSAVGNGGLWRGHL